MGLNSTMEREIHLPSRYKESDYGSGCRVPGLWHTNSYFTEAVMPDPAYSHLAQ